MKSRYLDLFQIIVMFMVLISPVFSTQSSALILNNGKIPVIIDSDGAPDDVYAIVYLLKHPDYEVIGLTLSCGVSYVQEGAQNFVKMLDYLGHLDIPVAAGKETPMYVNHTFPTLWREGSYNFYGLELPDTDLTVSEMNASELIISLVQETEQMVTLVALGPLTNVAIAFAKEPSIKENIEIINIMGGAIDAPGNVGLESSIPNFEAEWNFYIDPHAVDIVLGSQIPILLVPLDATNKVPITKEFKTKLGNEMVTKEAEIVHQFLDTNLYFWDILTVVALSNPEVVTLEMVDLEVVIDQENHEGEILPVDSGYEAQAAIDADKEAFETQFIAIINSTPSSDTSETDGAFFGFHMLIIGFIVMNLCVKFSSRKQYK
jgi:pyrimidine-specific ribonucleoside hydrolase